MAALKLEVAHLDHIVLKVSSLALMLNFYCNLLGFTVERQLTDIGLVQLRCGGSLIDLVPIDSPLDKAGTAAKSGHNMDHFCLTVHNYDQQQITTFCHAHNIEVSPEAERYGAEGMGPSIYLTDPEGNVLELKKAVGHFKPHKA